MKATMLMGLMVLFTILGCEKRNYQPQVVDVIGDTIRITKLRSAGQNSGATVSTAGKSSILTSKAADGDIILSQFPLIEHRNVIAIDYDSIPVYQIDQAGDTLSISYDIFEVSRDTISFIKGKLWLPADVKNVQAIHLGLPGLVIDSTTSIKLKVEVLDLDIEQDELFIVSVKAHTDSLTLSNIELYNQGYQEIGPDYYAISNDVPIYDQRGKISETTTGIEFPRVQFRGFLAGNRPNMNALYTVSIMINDADTISQGFEVFFVKDEVYSNRRCWLAAKKGCEDLFDN